jgi:two-component system LytT family response regulator
MKPSDKVFARERYCGESASRSSQQDTHYSREVIGSADSGRDELSEMIRKEMIPGPVVARARPLRCLVVDADVHQRQSAIDYLGGDPDIKEIFEAGNGFDAIQLVDRYAPDLMLLDVQMPVLGGIQVVGHIGVSRMPPTLFLTAFDQQSIGSLEAMALDYVLKPLNPKRLSVAVDRLKGQLEEAPLAQFRQKLEKSLSPPPVSPRYLDRFVIKSAERTELVRVESVDCIESAGVYLSLHVGSRRLIYRSAMQEVAASLDPRQFIRIHRSTIVNIDSIVALESISHGEFKVILTSGEQFRVSRTYRPLLEARLGQPL